MFYRQKAQLYSNALTDPLGGGGGGGGVLVRFLGVKYVELLIKSLLL